MVLFRFIDLFIIITPTYGYGVMRPKTEKFEILDRVFDLQNAKVGLAVRVSHTARELGRMDNPNPGSDREGFQTERTALG